SDSQRYLTPMGFKPPALRFVARDHKRRAFTGPVLTLGRHCMYATFADIQGVLRNEGIAPQPLRCEADRFTNIASWIHGQHQGFTSDRAFWTALGNLDVEALDVSDVEGADHIADLNAPVPVKLAGRYGLI